VRGASLTRALLKIVPTMSAVSASAGTARTLRLVYRLFMKNIRSLERGDALTLEMRQPVDREAWLERRGGHGWARVAAEDRLEALQRLLPWMTEDPVLRGAFNPGQLRNVVRSAFRAAPDTAAPSVVSSPSSAAAGSPSPTDPVDRALAAMRVLGEQVHMARCSSIAITDGVRVDVTSSHVGPQSEFDPEASSDAEDDGADEVANGGGATSGRQRQRHYHTYRVRVANEGRSTVQLLGRHWVVRDSTGDAVAEVARGSPGVVGCTPILKPGTCFAYYSGTDVDAKGGSMEGSFQMATLNARGLPEARFDAVVAPFRFIGSQSPAAL
jgi:uncharacterized protein affecting Mg2+/Co2+ transport